jgi:[acyl-carrier-protein] S-malonyltransferase
MDKTVGVIFPGQGSQSLGMLAETAREFPEVTAVFAEASSVLGYDLWQLTQDGPAHVLDQTAYTQPALLAASYAIWKILQKKKNIQPALLAGHSLGEYSALVCAEAISFADGIRLVAARGEAMQAAVPAGTSGLAAIVGLDNAVVSDLCAKAVTGHEVLSPANFNSPGQVVISGHLLAVERAITLAKAAGAKLAKLLPVSVASHSLLMKPAAENLSILLATIKIQPPKIPVVNNVDVKIYENPTTIRDGLVRQLFMPVRWVETINFFAAQGVTQLIECGPGKVLAGLNKRINTEMKVTTTSDLSSLKDFLGVTV